MAKPEAGAEDPPRTRSKLPILIGLVLALALGGGGFYSVYSGLVLNRAPAGQADADAAPAADVAFVPVTPLVVGLGPGGTPRYLRFSAQIETDAAHEKEIAHLMPRFLDVLNSYLRAVEVRDLDNPAALIRLRAQMLRRIQIVAGEGKVRDFLITEFVIN